MRRKIFISDITIKRKDKEYGMSFREKIELAKLMDSINVSVIETSQMEGKADDLLIKSLSSVIANAVIAVPVDFTSPENIDRTCAALKDAVHPRLQVCAPVSTVQMEYFYHKKADSVLKMVSEAVGRCAATGYEVEFEAEDATRCDVEFLRNIVIAAAEAGAGIVTLCDCAGGLLPEEFASLVASVRTYLPEGVRLGVSCDNVMHLADACSVAAVGAGADEIKASVNSKTAASISNVAEILASHSDALGVMHEINMSRINTVYDRILMDQRENVQKSPAAAAGFRPDTDDIRLTASDSLGTVLSAVRRLGYELGEEDCESVYSTFLKLAQSNGVIEAKELEAIVAAQAFQVPPTYKLDSYVINTGNLFTATCHLSLKKGDEILENVCIGDGPVDAAFQAFENAIGRHFEVDDFQIRSVTEGRQALGEALVRLRVGDKLYPGRGISTDIVGSSIAAYLNALNKIVYEEGRN